VLLSISVVIFKSFYVRTTSFHIIFQEFQKSANAVSLYLCLTLFFVLVASVFALLSQEIGLLFRYMPPLVAYSINIGGSILGILILTLFSYLRIPPLWQFSLFCLAMLIYITRRDRFLPLAWGVPLTIGVLILISVTDRDAVWSHYHRITLSSLLFEPEKKMIWQKYLQDSSAELERLPRSIGFNISINDDYFQMPLNLSDESVKNHPYLKIWRDNYDLPYKLRHPQKVLIVAGGAGNDAAAAIRHNVPEIDVVDIDGTIMELGKLYHPEKPYSDPRVRLYATDARSFFHSTDQVYDMIIFGYLDSHRLFSQISSIRLDSFLYTLESLMEAKQLLRPNGLLYVHSAASKSWVGERLFKMLFIVFGRPPLILESAISPVLLNGTSFDDLDLTDVRVVKYLRLPASTEMARDDWPYIYLQGKIIPMEYIVSILMMMTIAALAFGVLWSKARTLRPKQPHLHFLLLGVGFFLLETKNVTDMALLFGSTWIVNALVFTAVLAAILLANMVRLRLPPVRIEWTYVTLGALLLGMYFFPLSYIMLLPFVPRLLASFLIIGLPICLSSYLFASFYKESQSPSLDLGLSIFGSVLGGFLEYLSMIAGFRFLLLLALTVYASSYLLFFFQKRRLSLLR